MVLDSDNFDRMTKEGVWFIKFYAPWCGHCKRMAPVWEQLAKKLEGSGVNVAKVDADGETEIGEKFQIAHYPTFKVLEGILRKLSPCRSSAGPRSPSFLPCWGVSDPEAAVQVR